MGVHRADSDSRRARRSACVEAIIGGMRMLDFTTEVARVHAGIYADLAHRGELIGAHDMIIAATALATGCRCLRITPMSFRVCRA
jgi:tRNA(fMet)-specific endonuclease VapC